MILLTLKLKLGPQIRTSFSIQSREDDHQKSKDDFQEIRKIQGSMITGDQEHKPSKKLKEHPGFLESEPRLGVLHHHPV